jgi:ubiquinone/menaquinone biosynthesis C-methylase UbiE/acyl carrier protein
MMFDETYHAASSGEDPTFNIIGWSSSYTGLAIPAEEMREWVEQTVDRILALHPAKVLEIGCGTGLLLFRIAPHCTHYCGTDFAPKVLGALQEEVTKPEHRLPQVTLLERTAEDFTGLEGARFDTVILNSVVQYFPHVTYLLTVLQRALQAVIPGGRIFLGDVRSLPLLETFHTSVELHHASDRLSIAALKERIQKRLAKEDELAIDPAFFFALQQQYPQICQVDVLVKRGRYQNELTRYRYDVILHLSKQEPDPQNGHGPCSSVKQPSWLDGQKSAYTVTGIRQLLVETKPELLAIADVPNARLLPDLRAHALLHDSTTPLETVGDLRRLLQGASTEEGIDPEALWTLSEELPYGVDIRWSGPGAEGCYDAVFRRLDANKAPPSVRVVPSHAEKLAHPRPWRLYANNPLREKLARLLVPTWRSYLKERLPQYMVPAAFVVLDALPLSPNGKLDRRALPHPDPAHLPSKIDLTYLTPPTEVERTITAVWQELLQLSHIGMNENFFDLGGHSLLMVQVLSKLRKVLKEDLTMLELFQYPTIGSLAKHISQAQSSPPTLAQASSHAETRRASLRRRREFRQHQRRAGNQEYTQKEGQDG